MGILVVGSVALDTVETPYGKREDILGGSATFFSYAASFFSDVSLVGVVGEDFPEEHTRLLKGRGIDLEGLRVMEGKTFRWSGLYKEDMNERITLSTCLNVFENFQPIIPEKYKNIDYVFLANIDPELQIGVLSQMKKPKLAVGDTMNLWIDTKNDAVKRLLGMVDIIILNDEEARQFTGQANLYRAADIILNYGPGYAVIKKGEHGALLFGKDLFFSLPGYPVEEVRDPTGAGDAFAGGFVGYLAKVDEVNDVDLKKGVVYGSVMASFTVEDFSLDRLKSLTEADIEKRYLEFKKMTVF